MIRQADDMSSVCARTVNAGVRVCVCAGVQAMRVEAYQQADGVRPNHEHGHPELGQEADEG